MNKLIKSPLIKDKFYFWYREDDKYVGQKVALDKYEPYLTKLMLSKIKIGDIVIDIGANIGYDTVLFADKVGKKGKVIAIEPDPENFKILQKNIKENKLFNVVAVQAAIGDENKKMKIFESEENYGDHRMWENPSKQNPLPGKPESPLKEVGKFRKEVPVFCRRLDDLIKELGYEKIDFIKIDVQGFEYKVIEGGQKTINNDKPIIFFEYWPWGINKAGNISSDLTLFLKKIYKKVFYVDEYIQIHLAVSQKFLDKKCKISNEINDANLFVQNGRNLTDFLEQFVDFWPKKLIKRILGKPLT